MLRLSHGLAALPLLFCCVPSLLSTGCSSQDAASTAREDAAASVGAPPSTGAGVIDAATDAPHCSEAPLAILADESDGHLSRLFVEAELGATRAVFLFDTGSATTFVERPQGTPDPTPRAAEVVIGTCSLTLDGRPYPSDERSGTLDVVGFLGADTLLASPAAELDLAGMKIVRRVQLPLAADVTAWPTVRIDIVRGHILAHVVVDGEPLRMMLDTGSPHLLRIGLSGRAGDKEIRTSDAEGSPLTMYLGTAELKLGGAQATRAPILRAPSFPYFEETARLLGGNVQGLVGLSALGRRRVIVDRAASVVRVQP